MPRLLPGDKRLSGAQFQQLQQAVLDAYDDLQRFDQMLRFRLDRPRQFLSLANDLPTIVFNVIERAESESWTAELLQGARASRPENAMLLAFAQQFGLATATPPRQELEKRIRAANSFLNVVQWREGLGRVETQVCRVELKSGELATPLGTGFLLGPDVVMTNYHVMEKVIAGQVPPDRVVLRFDYKVLVDGVKVNPGQTYGLADQAWDLDHSEYSPVDEQVDPGGALPRPDQLDYALLRVKGTPGQDPVSGGKDQEQQAPPRAWIKLPDAEHDFAEKSAIFILQHPDGAPLKLSLDTDSVLGTNGNRTRVRYTTNTEPGSSGSPCFDADWNLVALHHSGDPNFSTLHKPTYNQGIPFSTIVKLLQERGTKELLGEQQL